jgi:hypothetical protein
VAFARTAARGLRSLGWTRGVNHDCRIEGMSATLDPHATVAVPRQEATLPRMASYKLLLDRGDESDLIVVEDYDSEVAMPPGFEFNHEGPKIELPHDGEYWLVERVSGRTVYCKVVPIGVGSGDYGRG